MTNGGKKIVEKLGEPGYGEQARRNVDAFVRGDTRNSLRWIWLFGNACFWGGWVIFVGYFLWLGGALKVSWGIEVSSNATMGLIKGLTPTWQGLVGVLFINVGLGLKGTRKANRDFLEQERNISEKTALHKLKAKELGEDPDIMKSSLQSSPLPDLTNGHEDSEG